MLTRAPSGAVNRTIGSATLFFRRHRIVTGSVAADEAEPHAVILRSRQLWSAR